MKVGAIDHEIIVTPDRMGMRRELRDVVLDPFNGVGTTTLVARKLDRNYIGIDISEQYYQKALDRIAEYERQPILL